MRTPASPPFVRLFIWIAIGYLAFGGSGVHVPCLACVFFYKYMMQCAPDNALESTIRFGEFFLLPGTIMFLVFFLVHSIAQITAFAKGKTPYPRWCWIFSLPVGMIMTEMLGLFGNYAIIGALTAGWISIGNIWMFAGLLITSKKAEVNSQIASAS